MTELELYTFLNDYAMEISDDPSEPIAWIWIWNIRDFTKLVGAGCLGDGGREARLQEHCIALDITEICEYHGIDPANIIKAFHG